MLRKIAVTGALVSILGIAAFFAPHEASAASVATVVGSVF
ncbi:hypothetical protein GGQ86_001580 [Xanthobacter flavus]|jgi:hypothetical protein|uniref:Uncharacterized protein n=1 Tax=Xanthobacter flavus TaxID=281 RepID=A0ABU1KE48_XANFL|nr:hypothetical protein [Xanthobacter flavus]NMN57476.1 hypothetical protein [Xanthobacter sp. SG618]